MRITKVKMIDNGVRGMEVHYTKGEKKGDMIFENEYVAKIKVPVNGELRKLFIGLEDDFYKLLGLADDISSATVLGVSIRNGVQLSGYVTPGSFGGFGVASMVVTEDGDYPFYLALLQKVNELIDAVTVWMASSTAPKAKQILMDFAEYGKDNLKKSLSEYNFDEMTEEDQILKATELLEKSGAIVLMQNETDGTEF